jgi:hypothetical protein
VDSLNDGERRLIAAAVAGEIWRPADGGKVLRASVLRALALGETLPGQNAAVRVHAKGIRVDQAQVSGILDFDSATVTTPLWFTDCDFDSNLELRQAKLIHLALRGCSVKGVHGHRVQIDGPCLMSRSENRPFRSPGRIDLTGAKIDGELSFLGAELGGAGPVALDANGANLGASLFLRMARISGLVDLTRITIAGNLHAQGAKLDHPGNEKVVMIARGARIGGDALFRHEFEATGMLDLGRAEIGGGIWFEGARLHVPLGTALSLNQARIGSALGLTQDGGSVPVGGALRGHLDLRGASVNELRDDGSMWPDRKTGFLKIDGFQYGRFGGRATPTSGRKRVRWLKLQRPEDLGRNFKSQPWEQLIRTLRHTGHTNDADTVAIAKQVALHRSGTLSWGQWSLSWFSGLLTGYGYLPMRSVYASALVVLMGAMIFASAERQGIMAPLDGSVLASQRYQETGLPPQDYPAFEPWAYSVETFVPFLEFEQEDRWHPARQGSLQARQDLAGSDVSAWTMYTRAQARLDEWVTRDIVKMWLRIQIVLGWILTSLALAGFSGYLRPSRD